MLQCSGIKINQVIRGVMSLELCLQVLLNTSDLQYCILVERVDLSSKELTISETLALGHWCILLLDLCSGGGS